MQVMKICRIFKETGVYMDNAWLLIFF